MKTKFYYKLFTGIFLFVLLSALQNSIAQPCSPLTTSYSTTESRCAATGSVQINAAGGSGNFMYRVSGVLNTNFSTNSLITGLPAGRYAVIIKDIISGCVYQNDSVTVSGDYRDPRFLMSKTDVTCINGSDGTITVYNQEFGRHPITYTIIAPSASNIGLQNTTGVFTGLLYGNYMVRLTDSCGGIQVRSMSIANYDWTINNFSVNRLCDSAAIQINLKDSKGNTSPNAVFNLFTYGVVRAPGDTAWYSSNTFTYPIGNKRSLKLVVKDKCGNVKTVSWTDNNKPAVDANIAISNKACSTFTATVTGVVNFTNPQFCIYNFKNFLIGCNTTGVFTGLGYGSYCIKITDACYDTTISRCFTVSRPVPSVNANISIMNKTCTDFTATVTGSSNLNNPVFCIYDKNNMLMYCNTTGIFTGLPYGNYCIKITNDPACYDTTITRCFTVTRPVPSVNNNVNISNLSCTGFTASIQDTANWVGPKFCLYDVYHVLIICNTTGVFNNLLYGTYCIEVTNSPGCYDTTIQRCFTVKRPVPSVNAAVTISSKTCTTFTAEIKGQQNINNAQYCLFDNNNVQISCNTSGKFTNLLYGTYCIKVTNNPSCYDTIITRCFSAAPNPLSFVLNAAKSCSFYGATDITVTINSGTPSYIIKVYDAANQLLISNTSSSGSFNITGLPDLAAPGQYKVVVTDQCNNKDSLFISPVPSVLTKKVTITKKCPSGINPDGTADVDITASTNMGTVTPKIIKKNTIPFVLNYNFNSGNLFSFYELPPAVYIIEYATSGCAIKVYDTVAVGAYTYPDLSKSSAYHCDNNTISVGAAASGGIAPFMYEIFQSVPALPSIISPLQSNPVFTFNNSTNYSLIRLRAIDACGNASINDVSILPLAPVAIIPPAGVYCINQAITLTVDTIANATYKWYHKLTPLDSVLVSSTSSYYIPVLFPADTGDYVCVVSVNDYCLNREASYHVGGYCGNILPLVPFLKGSTDVTGIASLQWEIANATNIKSCIVERSNGMPGNFIPLCKLAANNSLHYFYKDSVPLVAPAYYRIQIILNNGSVLYSNAVLLKNNLRQPVIQIYPNPVQQELSIEINGIVQTNYAVDIHSAIGKKIFHGEYFKIQKDIIKIRRDNTIADGLYIIVVTDLQSGQQVNYKIIFQ
jgi:hypothetical protein